MKRSEAYVSCKLNADLRIANILPIKSDKNIDKRSVELRSPVRDLCGIITREELINNFKTHKGKKIKLHQCKNGTIVVIGNDKRSYKALFIGDDTYRVVEAGREADLDSSAQGPAISYISSELFNKMFTVNDRRVASQLRAEYPNFFAILDKKNGKTYTRAKKSTDKEFSLFKKHSLTDDASKTLQNKKETNKDIVAQMLGEEKSVNKKQKLHLKNKSRSKNTEEQREMIRAFFDRPNEKSENSKKQTKEVREDWRYPKKQEHDYKYRAVFRLVDGYKNQTVGFILEDADGNKQRHHVEDVKILAERREIENIKIEAGEIVGNGIDINSLSVMEL